MVNMRIKRKCLKCDDLFSSEGSHNRLCTNCNWQISPPGFDEINPRISAASSQRNRQLHKYKNYKKEDLDLIVSSFIEAIKYENI